MNASKLRKRLLDCVSVLAMAVGQLQPALAQVPLDVNDGATTTPIKHVIIIIGENRTFDQVFATYVPQNGQTVSNLLSRGIINADGSPGPNFTQAVQNYANSSATYSISPPIVAPYPTLPPPTTGSVPTSPGETAGPPFASLSVAEQADYGLFPQDLFLLTTGASGLPTGVVDTRIANVSALPSGPFPLITPSGESLYDAYLNNPVHRFYQMWQQVDCSTQHATAANPSGCVSDLFPWVEVTIGAGSNGKPPPTPFTNLSTNEGATSMGFFNVQAGDMPYFKQLADTYALSDNYHQPVMGGTGANHIMLGSGDMFYYTDGNGNATTPPANQIENPNEQPGTNNYYTQDGYSGGSYTECADATQPGVASIVSYLQSLPNAPKPNCAPGDYYLLNNYNPGYYGNGQVADVTADPYTIPPSPVPTIADDLMAHQVSWAYFGEGWDDYLANPTASTNVYCSICNPFQYETAIMTNQAVREAHLFDTTDFYNDVQDGVLPAVSLIKPSGLNDGHPQSSKFDIFEAFVRKILTELQHHPKLWASTAVFITTDEGGGYYDSGYIQPLDYFGDGTRIPLIVVSPYSTGGQVAHSYADHVSLLKFIEKNWSLPPITGRSRDNYPNPTTTEGNPYVPTNGPAIDDLMDMFHFD